ncbi:MAG: DUF29 domain-containing protein [Snowella sp.]|nr:DUF29 domain-containing protein [Snowella sp.]
MKTLTKTLYDTDFNLWIEQTVTALKKGNLQELDLENLIEEIESMGKSDKRSLVSRLEVLLMHLLKWKYQPERRSKSWIATINEQRRKIRLILKDSPSLMPYLKEQFTECYLEAKRDAAKETNLETGIFLLICPFSVENVLNPEYFPE